MVSHPAAEHSCLIPGVQRYSQISAAAPITGLESNVVIDDVEYNVRSHHPVRTEPIKPSVVFAGPGSSGSAPPSGDLGFPKRESPFRQLLDESRELRRCPFGHMEENVVLRFVRLLEELVLDIRILFRTRALRDQGVS